MLKMKMSMIRGIPMFKQENQNDERGKEGENPNIDDKKISMLKKENPNEEGEIEM